MINIKSSVVEVGLNLLSFKYFLFRASPFDQRQRQHLCQKYRMDENTYRPNDVKIKSHFFTSYTQLQQISRYLDCVKDDATYIYCEGNNNIIVHIITLLYYWNVPASEPKYLKNEEIPGGKTFLRKKGNLGMYLALRTYFTSQWKVLDPTSKLEQKEHLEQKIK